MSLDVYLYAPTECEHCGKPSKSTEVLYTSNITHNLSGMADAAGLYDVLWRPDERFYTHAKQLIPPLKSGLARLKAHAADYTAMNPKNGWGKYEYLVDFVENYLQACKSYPKSYVIASR